MTDTPMPPDQPTPVELTEQQLDALSAAGNRALNDHYHESQCHCDAWPTSCVSSGNYFMGAWDTSAFDIGLPAVLGVWETLRNDRHKAKVAELRAEVARWRERTEEAENSEAQLKGRVRGLRAQVDELEAEREAGPIRDTPDAGTPRLTGLPLGLTGRARHDARVAMETARKTRRRAGACFTCGDVPDEWCPDCACCKAGCDGGRTNNPCTHPNAPWNTEPTP